MRMGRMTGMIWAVLAGAGGLLPAQAQGRLPEAACTARLERYQEVVSADRRTGNVNASVYAQIERELSRAAAACSAGRDREALSLIRQSQARHGYHT
jgi:hypothetical protein